MFLQRVTELIDSRGITRNRLLTDIGLNKNSFVAWENRGTVPSGNTLTKIADYFHVSTDYLLGRTDDPRPVGEEKEPTPAAEGGPDPELWKLIQQIPESRLPEVERYLRFQAEQKGTP